MRLKKIQLNNIRSYKTQEIEFPEGSVLLSGDIGSGKTSILLGIEFALFGLQPGQKGSSLLRNGEDEGGVIIEFEVEGKEVIVERTLKRGKTISQDYCAITVDGEKREISVTELKSAVLDLLNYPKEFAKKQNLLYKFTVYTPQEEMKEIILQDPETRINTLRHVFGIDKYKKILENTSIFLGKLREEKRMKEGITSTLERDKEEIISKENELESKQYNLVSVEKELFMKTEIRKRIQEEKESVSKQIEEKNKLQSEIEKTKIMISTKNDSIFTNTRLINQIKDQIKELANVHFDETQIPKLNESLDLLKSEKNKLNEKNLDISSQISSLGMKNQDNDTLKNKIANLKMCPTCLQDVNPVHKSNVMNRVESDTVENVKKIENLILEKQKISSRLNQIDVEMTNTHNKISELRLLKVRLDDVNDKKKRIEEYEKSNTSLTKDIELLNQHMDSLKATVFQLSKFDVLFQKKQQEFELASKEERMFEIRVAELKKEIDVFSKQIDELKEKVKIIESIKLELEYILKLETWFNKNFVPLISNIEKNVMVKLKKEFSSLFSEWFNMLVAENFNVRLDDEFTPIIEQQDYELDYNYLSGGERTAVALAYRLALTQVINSLLSKIKTKDLVILDEPTDGFSAAQLDKMREILEELNVGQLLIVSHEQKIEGFVQNVIKLRKEEGVSGKE